jgi:hypothetical protein
VINGADGGVIDTKQSRFWWKIEGVIGVAKVER